MGTSVLVYRCAHASAAASGGNVVNLLSRKEKHATLLAENLVPAVGVRLESARLVCKAIWSHTVRAINAAREEHGGVKGEE
jgi:hypothetical protein